MIIYISSSLKSAVLVRGTIKLCIKIDNCNHLAQRETVIVNPIRI
jgi:hypothetical protein